MNTVYFKRAKALLSASKERTLSIDEKAMFHDDLDFFIRAERNAGYPRKSLLAEALKLRGEVYSNRHPTVL